MSNMYCFFYFCRLLTEGTLSENGIHEGCKITLLPNVESGLVVSSIRGIYRIASHPRLSNNARV